MPRSLQAAHAAQSNPFPSPVTVEIEALAAPDTLLRLLEPLVVMQAMTRTVTAALTADPSIMLVRLDLGADRDTAERLVRKLEGAVTVVSARILSAPALQAVPA